MKISNSKKELARIVSENGGWRDGAKSAAQCKSDNAVSFYRDIPDRDGDCWWGEHLDGCDIVQDRLIANWHQSCLSRAEYLHLYPALGELCGKVTEENRHEQVWTNPPSIEQLAGDYRNKLAIATQAQEEADSHRCGAEVALSKLEIAAKELGFKIEPITARQEAELLITDWGDLRVGDEIKVFNFECPESESRRKQELMSGPCVVMRVEGRNVHIELKKNLPTKASHWDATGIDACDFKFIRRP